MSQANIKRALLTHLDSMLGIPYIVPNDESTSPNHGPYANVAFLLADPVVYTLGDDGLDEHRGVMQVLLKYPRGQGSGQLDEKADAIRESFRAGLKLNYDDQEVTIVNTGMGNQSDFENRFVCPVSIQFYAFTRR